MIIAVDGPAASGKGTLARQLAQAYNLAYLDTGSLYRAVALAVLKSGGDPADPATATAAAISLNLNEIDEAGIRTPEVGAAASIVAAIDPVRRAIRDLQVDFARNPPADYEGAVLDGRDIGTVICPDADVKLFIDADLGVRARRRFEELYPDLSADSPEFRAIRADLEERDRRDSTRTSSPLKKAADAHLLDTSNLSIETAFRAACEIVDRVLSKA